MAMTRGRRIGGLGAAMVLAAGATVLAGAPVATSGAQSSCASPYAPAGWATGGSGGFSDSSPGFRSPAGTTTTLAQTRILAQGANAAPIVDVALPGGVVTLGHLGHDLEAATIGDLDHDGIPEHWIGDIPGMAQLPTASWVLPGTTAAGTYDVATVGIATWAGFPWALAGDLADWDGDGVDDLLLVGTDPSTSVRSDVFDGSAVMAAGSGGDATGDIPVFTAPGSPFARGSVGAGVALVSGWANDVSDRTAGERVWVTTASGTTAFSTLPAPALNYPPTVAVTDSGADGVFLLVSRFDRSGSTVVVWRLDDPCGGLPPVAEPVAADAVIVTPAITG
jgi:hypothetical protein